jgi:hypothetical protein
MQATHRDTPPEDVCSVAAGLLARGSSLQSYLPGVYGPSDMSLDSNSPLTVAGAAPASPCGSPDSLLASDFAIRKTVTTRYGDLGGSGSQYNNMSSTCRKQFSDHPRFYVGQFLIHAARAPHRRREALHNEAIRCDMRQRPVRESVVGNANPDASATAREINQWQFGRTTNAVWTAWNGNVYSMTAASALLWSLHGVMLAQLSAQASLWRTLSPGGFR